MAAIGKVRAISLPSRISNVNGRVPAHKGHFVVYSADNKRFVVPLTYLKCNIFRELLRMSEEEFGLPRDGPITLPCDAASMEYIVSLVRREVSEDLETALILSILAFTSHCSPKLPSMDFVNFVVYQLLCKSQAEACIISFSFSFFTSVFP
ncbi:hypothetical protein FNV43_RR12051 [Rhamnella rubrinervis]|uniref:Uncharacterized protein n=1 Tax=Rhamnella rubrinervis TaxID=2594499 RepID=A0A8K0MI72_9ROSA|nr:hypothetical protein FNV43_RR12051 [Rhamnella rubrinervis]